MGSFEGQEVCGTFVTAGTVFSGGVVPELISGGLSEEVGFGGKDLGIEQFGFDGVVDAFDIGIGIGAGGRIKVVLGTEGLLDSKMKALGPVVDGIAIEFTAQVSGNDDLAGIEAVLLEVLEETLDGQGGIGLGEFIAVGQELGTTG